MPRQRAIWVWVLWTFAAGLAVVLINGYTAPFSSNQNTYFLHGLAAAGYGELSHDWMTAHADTFPFFTHLITAMYWFGRPVGDALAFVFYVLSCGIYALSIVLICRRFFPSLALPSKMLAFLVVLAFFHSAALARFSGGITAVPVLGVALFYPLGGIFQPQAFAVLLLAGVAAFVWNRPVWGAALIAAGCVMHPAYLAAGGFLVLGMLIALQRQGTPYSRILLTGATAFLIVLPMVSYIVLTYASSDPEITRLSHTLMAELRSPHHTLLSRWLWHPQWGIAPHVLVKFSLCAVAILIVRRTALGWVMGTCVAGMALLTAGYGLTGNHSIGVAYPWRGFALIVPLSTALVSAWGLSRFGAALGIRESSQRSPWRPALHRSLSKLKFYAALFSTPHHSPQSAKAVGTPAAREQSIKRIAGIPIAWRESALSLMILVCLTALGGYTSVQKHKNRFQTTKALHAFVKDNVDSSDLYLLPSSDLTMMSFRLETGAPLFVDLKSHPVTAAGFLEWYRRLRLAAPAFEKDHRINCPHLREVLATVPAISHVVSSDKKMPCPELKSELSRIYSDTHYSVWERKL